MKSMLFKKVIYVDYDMKDDPYFTYLLHSFADRQAVRIVGNDVEEGYELYRIIPYEDKLEAIRQDRMEGHFDEGECVFLTRERFLTKEHIVGIGVQGEEGTYVDLEAFCVSLKNYARNYYGINTILLLTGIFCFSLGFLYDYILAGFLIFLISFIWVFFRVPNKLAFIACFLDGIVIGKA